MVSATAVRVWRPLTTRVYLPSFSSCCRSIQIFKILRNSPKIRTYSSLRSSKVIDLGANRKRICNFLLVIKSNCTYPPPFSSYWRISFENSWLFDSPSGGTPCNTNVIYTLLESTFSGLQICRRHYGSVFSGGCILKSRNHAKFRQNLTLQQFKVIQGHRYWCQSKTHMRLSISH